MTILRPLSTATLSLISCQNEYTDMYFSSSLVSKNFVGKRLSTRNYIYAMFFIPPWIFKSTRYRLNELSFPHYSLDFRSPLIHSMINGEWSSLLEYGISKLFQLATITHSLHPTCNCSFSSSHTRSIIYNHKKFYKLNHSKYFKISGKRDKTYNF
jgi:hypothetical protein